MHRLQAQQQQDEASCSALAHQQCQTLLVPLQKPNMKDNLSSSLQDTEQSTVQHRHR